VASCGIVSAGEVTISAERVARVFYAGEPISLCVTADCSRQKASFEVYDYFEMHWYSGEVTIGAGQTTVVEIPRKLPFGWYGFRISVDGAMVEDAFCVIPQPYTYTRGDDALFHMQLSTYDERHYAAAAQLGIRCLRTDLSWPDIEQDAGQYSFELFRGKLQLCRKYGMRLMATVGYTPGWNAVQPQNGPDDWIREASFVWHPRSVSGRRARYCAMRPTLAHRRPRLSTVGRSGMKPTTLSTWGAGDGTWIYCVSPTAP